MFFVTKSSKVIPPQNNVSAPYLNYKNYRMTEKSTLSEYSITGSPVSS